jgi:hypothetical protein
MRIYHIDFKGNIKVVLNALFFKYYPKYVKIKKLCNSASL